MLEGKRRDLAEELLLVGAIKFGDFRLKLHETNPHAPLSPIYVDLRVLRSFPDVMDMAADVYNALTTELHFDVLADVPTAATPVVAVVSHKTKVPMVSPRTGVKAYGTMGAIDGVFAAGQVALVVDDLVTRANSKLEAIATLEANGLIVRNVVVLIDREQGGVAELARRGYTCTSAFRLSRLLDHYLETGSVGQEDYNRTMLYLSSTGA